MYQHRIKLSVTFMDFFLSRNICLNGNTNCCFSEILWNCHMWFLKLSAKQQKVVSNFIFSITYLCMMLLDDFSVSCKQRLLTLQFENELDGACYSLLAALLLVWSPCCRIFKFNAVYFPQIRKPTINFQTKLITELIH